MSRISPEAPVPVVDLEQETWSPGGMANAAVNASALDGTVVPIGIFGDDFEGERLASEFRDLYIWEVGLVRGRRRKTTVKTRILGGSQQIVRVDVENRAPLDGLMERNIIELIRDRGLLRIGRGGGGRQSATRLSLRIGNECDAGSGDGAYAAIALSRQSSADFAAIRIEESNQRSDFSGFTRYDNRLTAGIIIGDSNQRRGWASG